MTRDERIDAVLSLTRLEFDELVLRVLPKSADRSRLGRNDRIGFLEYIETRSLEAEMETVLTALRSPDDRVSSTKTKQIPKSKTPDQSRQENVKRLEVTGSRSNNKLINDQDKNVFLVHGHDQAAKESVARFVEKLGLRPIILHEQPNAGRTIIEKFEDHSNVGFAIALLTPDDVGAPKDKPNAIQPRARQNVILELGYFMGKLGRGRVCALYKEGVEVPTDYQGVLYIPMDSAGAWKMQLAKEIKNAGIDVDLNKL